MINFPVLKWICAIDLSKTPLGCAVVDAIHILVWHQVAADARLAVPLSLLPASVPFASLLPAPCLSVSHDEQQKQHKNTPHVG